LPWVLVGAGGLAVVGGVILFAVGASDVSSANSACGGNGKQCNAGSDQKTADAIALGDRGVSRETAGGVIAGIGVAAVAGGLIWHFVGAKDKGAPSATGAVRVDPALAPGYAGLSLGAAF
jgi:hypothetical protein